MGFPGPEGARWSRAVLGRRWRRDISRRGTGASTILCAYVPIERSALIIAWIGAHNGGYFAQRMRPFVFLCASDACLGLFVRGSTSFGCRAPPFCSDPSRVARDSFPLDRDFSFLDLPPMQDAQRILRGVLPPPFLSFFPTPAEASLEACHALRLAFDSWDVRGQVRPCPPLPLLHPVCLPFGPTRDGPVLFLGPSLVHPGFEPVSRSLSKGNERSFPTVSKGNERPLGKGSPSILPSTLSSVSDRTENEPVRTRMETKTHVLLWVAARQKSTWEATRACVARGLEATKRNADGPWEVLGPMPRRTGKKKTRSGPWTARVACKPTMDTP